METLRAWGKEGLRFKKELGSGISESSGEKRSNYLFQSIGIAKQRGNTISISGNVPSAKKLDKIYYI